VASAATTKGIIFPFVVAEAPATAIVVGNTLVGNFSSPHEFKFVGGEVLPAASPEVAKTLSLEPVERILYEKDSIQTIQIEFRMSKTVKQELLKLKEFPGIILVPLPVLQALKLEFPEFTPENTPFRTIRVADRVTKEIFTNKFCW
jgi:hypothetical protein